VLRFLMTSVIRGVGVRGDEDNPTQPRNSGRTKPTTLPALWTASIISGR
jgi:hypothetical protein